MVHRIPPDSTEFHRDPVECPGPSLPWCFVVDRGCTMLYPPWHSSEDDELRLNLYQFVPSSRIFPVSLLLVKRNSCHSRVMLRQTTHDDSKDAVSFASVLDSMPGGGAGADLSLTLVGKIGGELKN